MPKAFAIHTLTLCEKPGETNDNGKITKRAVIKVIPAGSVINLGREQFAEFQENGAVRPATEEEIAIATVRDPDASPTKAQITAAKRVAEKALSDAQKALADARTDEEKAAAEDAVKAAQADLESLA